MVPRQHRSKAFRQTLRLALATLAFAAPAHGHGSPRAHVAELTREIAEHRVDAGLLLERPDFLRIERDFAAALADLARADSLAPGLARADVCRARIRLDAGEPAAALAPLDRHLARHPSDGGAWALRAAAHRALGRTAESIADLDRAIAETPAPDPDLYLDRARAWMSLGGANREPALAGLAEGLARLGAVPALESLARELGGSRTDKITHGPPVQRDLAATEPQEAVRAAAVLPAGSGPGLPASPAATLVTRGPYLQCSTRHEITVRWRTSPATSSRVRWGSAPGTLDGVRADPAVTTEHVTRITSLEAGQRYWYSIGSMDETLAGDSTFYFWTNPESTSTGPTRLWVIGDSGLPGPNQIGVRDSYFAWCGAARTHLWLMLGDNAYYSGTDAEYQAGLFDPYRLALRHLVLWPTRGNHDLVYTGANNDYYDHFTLPAQAEAGGVASGTEAYYAVDYANLRLVCLDSEGTSLAPAVPCAHGCAPTSPRTPVRGSSRFGIIRRTRRARTTPTIPRTAMGKCATCGRTSCRCSIRSAWTSVQTTEIYLRADPHEKLEDIEAVVPPSLRRGRFMAPDQLLALLQPAGEGSHGHPIFQPGRGRRVRAGR
jgi:tetratricopeptide (TPR) repeat protein